VALADASTPQLVLPTAPSGRRGGRRKGTSGRLSLASGALAAPFAILFLVFFIVPIVYAIVQSFLGQDSGGLGLSAPTIRFVGLQNYIQAITDPEFGAGLGRIGIFALINIPLTIGLGLLFALLMDVTGMPFRGFFRVVYFLPYAIPGVVSGILWAFLYSPSLSPYGQIFQAIGTGQVDFLSPQTVIFSIANIVIWQFAGYNMLILTASLNAIPPEQYEAARLDGCGRWREAFYIKIPQLVPAIIMTVLFAVIGTLQLFNEPLILSLITKSVTSTFTPNLMAYTEAFSNNNTYLAAAISVILAVVTAVCSFVFLSIVNKRSAL
jgi:multiple sugar transport system permease protein